MRSKLQSDPASHWASEDVDSRLGWRELYATPAFMSHYHALRPVIRRGKRRRILRICVPRVTVINKQLSGRGLEPSQIWGGYAVSSTNRLTFVSLYMRLYHKTQIHSHTCKLLKNGVPCSILSWGLTHRGACLENQK